MGSHLPATLIETALTIVQTIGTEYVRVLALSNLAAHLPPQINAGLLHAAPQIVDEWLRASLINKLVEYVPDAGEAVDLARAIVDAAPRAAALSGIAQHVLDEPQAELLNEALAAARSIEADSGRAEALIPLLYLLPDWERPTVTSEALAATRAVPLIDLQAELLRDLLEFVSEEEYSARLRRSVSGYAADRGV